jgi:hypothetical protein
VKSLFECATIKLDSITTTKVMAKEGFETFSVYRFSMDYPTVCRVEFNPKSRREAGDVVFHFPDHEKVFLSWRKLEDAQKKFPTVEEQAEHSLSTVSKSRQLKGFEKIKHGSLEINSHRGVYNHVKVEEVPASLFGGKRTIEHEALSLHLHCESTSRYFVIYALLSSNAPEDFADLFLDIVQSFKCH